MKIAFASLFKEGFGGGEGRVAHEVAHHFAGEHDVALICPDRHTRLRRCEDGLQVLGIKSVGEGNICVPMLTSKQVKAIFEFLDAFRPDIVHAHEPASLGLIAQIWAKMHRVLFVHTAHVLPSRALGFGAAAAFKALKGSLTTSVARAGLKDFYDNCDAVIALNRFAAEDIREFGYRGKLFTVPNGRNLAVYASCAPADVRTPVKVLTFTGFISQRKNQLYLVQVLAQLGDGYRLQIVGEAIDKGYAELISETVAELGVEGVRFLGQIAHDDIPALLEGTHVFVSASTMEVQSLSVIEALASGTPVVGLANETLEELVDDDVGACLPLSAEPAVFAQRVRQICESPQRDYAQLCRGARDRVKDLDWSKVMGLTVAAYRELLVQHPPAESDSEIAGTIAWVRSEEVRQFLLSRLELTSRRLGRVAPHRGYLKALNRVSGRTWAVVGMTVVVSVVGGVLLQPAVSEWIKRLRSDLSSVGKELSDLASEWGR